MTAIYSFYSAKWVQVDGIEYRKPCVLVDSIEDDSDPVFASLENIYVALSEVYLEVSVQLTIDYSTHFHAHHQECAN